VCLFIGCFSSSGSGSGPSSGPSSGPGSGSPFHPGSGTGMTTA
jgi:hypothetical protein